MEAVRAVLGQSPMARGQTAVYADRQEQKLLVSGRGILHAGYDGRRMEDCLVKMGGGQKKKKGDMRGGSGNGYTRSLTEKPMPQGGEVEVGSVNLPIFFASDLQIGRGIGGCCCSRLLWGWHHRKVQLKLRGGGGGRGGGGRGGGALLAPFPGVLSSVSLSLHTEDSSLLPPSKLQNNLLSKLPLNLPIHSAPLRRKRARRRARRRSFAVPVTTAGTPVTVVSDRGRQSSGREQTVGKGSGPSGALEGGSRPPEQRVNLPDKGGGGGWNKNTNKMGGMKESDVGLSEAEVQDFKVRLKEQRERGLKLIRSKFGEGGKRGEGAPVDNSVDPRALVPGEFIVHKRVGIGQFVGMRYETPKGKTKPALFIFLQYADGLAKLKASQADRLLYRYRSRGEVGKDPRLSKLKDTTAWERQKRQGRMVIQKLVVDMMELYVNRLRQSRQPYIKMETEMTKFASSFPYTPTPDQVKAFIDVEHDLLEKTTPMDRLVCGDVGFGKTEVALRAILLVISNKKQVMVLAPTTVLVKQHYTVIKRRFINFPSVSIGMLSRLQKDKEKREVVGRIEDGTLNIVIGTHALLGNAVNYRNVGLLVVDEEQRFGVKQKEKISAMKTNVDVLMLSATPIPRTLYMALSGFRDTSLINTPPPERRPIQTHLMVFREDEVRKAVQAELDRGGQIYYVVPRIAGIDKVREMLRSTFPQLRVDVAHGQRRVRDLEEAMESFAEGESQVLLCTTIIESGLDISNVNTIIIEDVHCFGLAQLYQLRGRVGRADQVAHAYLFHPKREKLKTEALERLRALEECCGLGEGFKLAERDMVIRGIGTVFGEKQSGEASRLGMDLYLEMLYEGLEKVGHQSLPKVEYDAVQLDVDFSPAIPEEYVPSEKERERIVKEGERVAATGMKSLIMFTETLRTTFGREPPTVEMWLKTLYVKRAAADLGISKIASEGATITLKTAMTTPAFNMLVSSIETRSLKKSLTFTDGRMEITTLIDLSIAPVDQFIEIVFTFLADMRNGLPSFVRYLQ